jgi:hypothetical protein
MTDLDIDLSMPIIPMATATPVPMDGSSGGYAPPTAGATSHMPSADSMRLLSTATAQHQSKSSGGGATSTTTTTALDQHQLSSLALQGYPMGLAQEMGRTRGVYPLRFWVVDNSGSMRMDDGHELRGGSSTQAHIRVVPCTRWTELQGTVHYHATLAGLLQATTIFKMLNDPGPHIGPQEFAVAHGGGGGYGTVNGGAGDMVKHDDHHQYSKQTAFKTATTTTIATAASADDQVQMAQSIIAKCEPSGVTPLTRHLEDIKHRIVGMETALRANGQQVCVVLATDGLPSNHHGESTDLVQAEFVQALKALQALPVWIGECIICSYESQSILFCTAKQATANLLFWFRNCLCICFLVVRLCTDDDEVVEYYNQLDAMLELPRKSSSCYGGSWKF